MIRVVVVEDDFRVAGVHVAFTEQVAGFRVVATARTGAEARAQVEAHRPDLLLLDNYLPDEPGMDLLRDLDVDAIVLSAASDANSIRLAMRRGALNYLIKPFTAEQLGDRLTAYAEYRAVMARSGSLSQDDVDGAVHLLHLHDRPMVSKGQSPATVRLVAEALQAAAAPQSAAQIATRLGIARPTAQRYLAHLANQGTARMTLRYGATGRPEHLYEWTARFDYHPS